MNQTSVPSFVVPVFPPAGYLNCDPTLPAAVPRWTTSFIALTMSHASSCDITGTDTGSGVHSVLPALSSTFVIAMGCERLPRVANAVYAATISIG